MALPFFLTGENAFYVKLNAETKSPRQTRREHWTDVSGKPPHRGGSLPKASWRNLLNVKRHGLFPLLNFTFGEVFDNPVSSDETRKTILWKWLRWVCLMQR